MKDNINDSIFVSVFASPLGASQFKSVGTANVRMELFTVSKDAAEPPIKKDDWVLLP